MRLMKIKKLLTIILLISSSNLLNADEFIPGESWLNYSEHARFMWAWGVVDGQALILEENQDLNDLKINNKIQSNGLGAVVDIMTEYYKDPANIYIPKKYMVIVASMKLNGAKESDLNEKLALFRNYAMWLKEKRKGD